MTVGRNRNGATGMIGSWGWKVARLAAIIEIQGSNCMARWPRHAWTSIFTYGTVFVMFPLLCLLAYAWVRGWIF